MTSATIASPTAPSVIPCEQALAVARQDAEGAYKDLTFYRIVLALEPDGWHVDYELPDPRLKGGGPHYVIDAILGTILSKRYDQ